MKKNVTIIILFIIVTINLVMNVMNMKASKKIAYVRSQDLVYAYTGMKEMQLKFQEQSKGLESNLDTLKFEFQRTLNEYQSQLMQLTTEEKMMRENLLRAQQNNIEQYTKSIEFKSQEEEKKMLEGVLNQVNSFVEKYGENNGYDLIFGTTTSGNILFGIEAIDITQELIQELNISYEGK